MVSPPDRVKGNGQVMGSRHDGRRHDVNSALLGLARRRDDRHQLVPAAIVEDHPPVVASGGGRRVRREAPEQARAPCRPMRRS